MRAETAGTLSVTFSNTPDGAHLSDQGPGHGALDLGAVSYGGGAFSPNVNLQKLHGRFVVSTHFSLSVQQSSPQLSTATVLAALAVPEPAFVLRLDGLTLGTTPQVLQGQARMGVRTQHRLEIEVPSSVTEKNSQLHNAILFQVIAN